MQPAPRAPLVPVLVGRGPGARGGGLEQRGLGHRQRVPGLQADVVAALPLVLEERSVLEALGRHGERRLMGGGWNSSGCPRGLRTVLEEGLYGCIKYLYLRTGVGVKKILEVSTDP